MDSAAQDVQAAINAAAGTLPANLPYPPTYAKVNPADAPILSIALSSDATTLDRVSDAADSLLQPKLSQIDGVGKVTVQGGLRPAVRVRTDPERLAAYGLSAEDVRAAVVAANVNGARGGFDGPRQSFALGANDQLLVADQATAEFKRLLTGVKGGEVTGITVADNQRVMLANIQHPGNGDPSVSNFPEPFTGASGPVPRDATIVIVRKNGGIVGS